jgi:predicted ArsR family transcriptional regulator
MIHRAICIRFPGGPITSSRRADHEATWCGLTAAARHRHIDGGQTWIRHEEAVEKLSATQAEIGFAPQAVAEGARYQLRLHQCPFHEVAEGHQDVVCGPAPRAHAGRAGQMRAPLTADRLQPFTEPSLCIAHLDAA